MMQEPGEGEGFGSATAQRPVAAEHGGSGHGTATAPAAPPSLSGGNPGSPLEQAAAPVGANSKAAAGVLGHWSETGSPTPAPGKPGQDPPATTGNSVGGQDRILSQDPKYATEAYVPWFRDQVKAAVTPWGRPFDGGSVKLDTVNLAGKPVKAMILTWNADWDTAPLTQEIPLNMQPIDARASVAGVKNLKGWSKVEAGERSVLENLLGGETNQLSLASRGHLRGQYKDLVPKSDTDQANALKAALSVKTAMPNWAEESGSPKSVKADLTGPVEKKDYAFTGKKADAEQWSAKFDDGVQFAIVAPKGPTPGFHNHTVKETVDTASHLPKSVRAVINTVMLNPVTNPKDPDWAVQYKTPNFHSYMTAGADGIVTIYPDKTETSLPGATGMRNAMTHETGHTWSFKTWGQDTKKGGWVTWKKAMDDDKVPVSGYATSAITEDVAETIRIYQATKGNPSFEEYKKIVPHRFEILGKEYDK